MAVTYHRFPKSEYEGRWETARRRMGEAGLEDSHYYNLSGGIVALHVGYRY